MVGVSQGRNACFQLCDRGAFSAAKRWALLMWWHKRFCLFSSSVHSRGAIGRISVSARSLRVLRIGLHSQIRAGESPHVRDQGVLFRSVYRSCMVSLAFRDGGNTLQFGSAWFKSGKGPEPLLLPRYLRQGRRTLGKRRQKPGARDPDLQRRGRQHLDIFGDNGVTKLTTFSVLVPDDFTLLVPAFHNDGNRYDDHTTWLGSTGYNSSKVFNDWGAQEGLFTAHESSPPLSASSGLSRAGRPGVARASPGRTSTGELEPSC